MSFGGGGGFLSGSPTGSQTSPGGGARKASNQSLRPVTITQILRLADQAHPDAEFMLDGAELGQVTFVAKVASMNPSVTNIAYEVYDHTGSINVRQWVEGGDEGSGNGTGIEQDSYVRVVGNLKTFNNKRHIQAIGIHLIKNFNELIFHDLEVIYVHLALTRGLASDGPAPGAGAAQFGHQQIHNAMANPYAQSNGHGAEQFSDLAPLQRKVMAYIASLGSVDQLPINGIEIAQIARGCPGTPVDKLRDQIELLVSEGHLYTTIDEDHVMPTS